MIGEGCVVWAGSVVDREGGPERALATDAARHIDEAVRKADVIMMLRVQKERLAGLKLAVGRYVAHYQLTTDRLKLAKNDVIVMHPGPMVRGMEIQSEVADSPKSVIEEQVQNGVYVRMAILTLCMGLG